MSPEQNIFEGYGANGKLHDEVWNERNWKIQSKNTNSDATENVVIKCLKIVSDVINMSSSSEDDAKHYLKIIKNIVKENVTDKSNNNNNNIV